MQLQKLTTH